MDTRRDRRGIAGRSYDTRAVDSARQTARALRNSRKRLKFNRWCVCVCVLNKFGTINTNYKLARVQTLVLFVDSWPPVCGHTRVHARHAAVIG